MRSGTVGGCLERVAAGVGCEGLPGRALAGGGLQLVRSAAGELLHRRVRKRVRIAVQCARAVRPCVHLARAVAAPRCAGWRPVEGTRVG